jgi:hypothetical protein
MANVWAEFDSSTGYVEYAEQSGIILYRTSVSLVNPNYTDYPHSLMILPPKNTVSVLTESLNKQHKNKLKIKS